MAVLLEEGEHVVEPDDQDAEHDTVQAAAEVTQGDEGIHIVDNP